MSPTMTEGGIASWKKNEGESFAAGDVLLEVETDKATIDVEAQDDGVMGKIIVEAGSSKIPVGQVIAVLAEEGDDLSSIEVPKDLAPPGQDSSSSSSSSSPEPPKEEKKRSEEPKKEESKPAETEQKSAEPAVGHDTGHGQKEIKHSQPIFPSVSRLLIESPLTSEQISKLKGTGRHGMLTKGDVLLALGKIKNAYGSAEKLNLDIMGPSGKRLSEATSPSEGAAPAKKEEPLDGPALRRLILQGLAKATEPAKPIVDHTPTPLPRSSDAEFDSILAPYASLLPAPKPRVDIPSADKLAEIESQGGKKSDEWAGLF
ncbi:pyruvate dehydrogenase X component [Kwoniella heveanensis BCC8398]|uniref:Pyruvate dehydrogenase X component n=1 Tax=Kwoniella heveanensis BCC8398 TaxID=1296120 RepID=A0A1B9GNY1_9TREE|nr:pyruvate dehydrogenase X component [Kwoniella heveanensis BCC8398]